MFADKQRTLIVKSPSGVEYQNISYDESHSFWTSSKFEEEITVPENAEDGYAYLIFMYGEEVKATNWFHVGSNPLKDIAVNHFNRFLEDNYQGNLHTFNNCAINVEQNISASRIKIGTVNSTLKREIERPEGEDTDYILYYTMSIDDLNYTLVDLSTGESYNRTMYVSTVITSREPLLAELTSEYERALSSGTTSDIVLGATNIRTFTYGPWQHYLNGPLNIVTGPSLTSSVNAGTLYTQKRVFDSVDPWALTYTTYYSGKVLYNDISQDTSSYEENKGCNLSTTYDDLSGDGTFNMSVSDGINESMKDADTSIEEVENNSRIIVSVSNFTNEVYSSWIYNDADVWTDDDYPDLIHDVTHEVYSGTIRGQVFRDGFSAHGILSCYGDYGWYASKSVDTHSVSWKGYFPVIVTHTGSIEDKFPYSGTLPISYDVAIPESYGSWELTGEFAEKIEKRLQKSMKLVPCGLPVIPPHWVCTVNVWEYDVKGAYREFEVIDNDNECIFNPYFGHDAQVYVRKNERIFHPIKKDNNGDLIVLGENEQIAFEFSGYAATIVGLGPKGVGDKIGDRDEKSIYYDDFESQF